MINCGVPALPEIALKQRYALGVFFFLIEQLLVLSQTNTLFQVTKTHKMTKTADFFQPSQVLSLLLQFNQPYQNCNDLKNQTAEEMSAHCLNTNSQEKIHPV